MKKCSVGLFLCLGMLFFTSLLNAATEFNQDVNPEVIFGSGNSNGQFTTSRVNGLELGLRAKIPFNGNIRTSGDGRYQYQLSETDFDNDPQTPNAWNFDWTINTNFDFSNGTELAIYSFELGLDVNPSEAKDFLIFDPVAPTAETPFYDHYFGNNTTGNGEGQQADDGIEYLQLLFSQTVLQQSWRYAFFQQFPPMDTYDPNTTGTYHIYLLARNNAGIVVARTEIVVEIINDGFVSPEVIFGSGNSNGEFTIDTNESVEIGLRAKIPFSGTINNNLDGTYSYSLDETNHDNDDGTTARRWNIDWTINTDTQNPNSDGSNIEDFTYEMGFDADPSLATDFFVFDPITPNTAPINTAAYDHAFGDNDTANGGGTTGTEANYSDLLSNSNVVQQSWRYAFFDQFPPLDNYNPDVPGNYVVYLLARNQAGEVVARTEVQVLIGGAPKRTVPVAIDDYLYGVEDEVLVVPAEFGLLSNDADADMDSLSVLNPGVFPGNGITSVFTIGADGSVEVVPAPNANGVATLSYQLTDGFNVVDALITVEIGAVNDAPTFDILGDLSFNSLDEQTSTFIIENFTSNYDFGPPDEENQEVDFIELAIISDTDEVLNEAFITSFGTLVLDLNLNYGTAMLEVVVKDNGSSELVGEAFSDPVPFSISYLDLIFANDFESADGFGLLDVIDKLVLVDSHTQASVGQHYQARYDFPTNSIHFMGHAMRLDQDFQSKQVIMQFYQWLDEVIQAEGLSLIKL